MNPLDALRSHQLLAACNSVKNGGEAWASGINAATQLAPALLQLRQTMGLIQAARGANAGKLSYSISVESFILNRLTCEGLTAINEALGTNILNPSFTIGYTRTESTSRWQTLAGASLMVHDWIIKAEEVAIDNGFKVDVTGRLKVTAKNVTVRGAQLHHSTETSTTSIGISANVRGTAGPTLTANFSCSESSGIHYENAKFHASSTEADLDQLTVIAGNMLVGEISGRVDSIKVESKQDERKGSMESVGISISPNTANVSLSFGDQSARTVAERSSFEVYASDLTTRKILVKNVELHGADLTALNVDLNLESLECHDLNDFDRQSQIAFAANPLDNVIDSLTNAKLNVGGSDYEARHRSAIYSSNGGSVSVSSKEVVGDSVTHNPSERHTISRDSHYHVEASIPSYALPANQDVREVPGPFYPS